MQNGERAAHVKHIDTTTDAQAEHSNSVNEATAALNAASVYTNGINSSLQNDESTLEDDSIPARPSKKRRLNDPLKELRPSPSRPTSPPWKKFAVEGPTSLIVGGRRVSSRNNPAAVETQSQPQPDDNKRRTRGVVHETPGAPRPRGASLRNGTQPASVGKAKGKGHQSDGNSVTKAELKAPSPKVPRKAKPSVDLSQPPPSPRPDGKTGAKVSAKRRKQSPSSSDRPKKRRSHRVSDLSTGDAIEATTDAHKAISDTFTGPSPRLRLKLRAPTIPLLHPGHIPAARKHLSFREWFQSEDVLDDDDKKDRMNDDRVRAEVNIRLRLLREGQPGGLLSTERCSVYAPDPPAEPPLQYGPWDHIAQHAVYFQKLQQRESLNHKKLAKVLASDCATWYRELITNAKYQGKYQSWVIPEDMVALTAEEMAAEAVALEKARYKGLMRDLVQSWELVKLEVDKLKLAQYDEEQRLLGRQEMKKMLGKSAALLGQRLRRPSDASSLEGEEEYYSATDTGYDDRDEYDESVDLADDVGTVGDAVGRPRSLEVEESDDSENMSSSEDDSEEPGRDDDAGLTQEQLREKYQSLPDTSLDDDEAAEDVLEDEDSQDEDGVEAQSPGLEGMLELPGRQGHDYDIDSEEPEAQIDDDMPEDSYQGIDPSQVKLEEVDEVLMDDTDEPMTDEDMSESDDEQTLGTEDEDADEGSEEEDDEDNPLWGFFSNKKIEELKAGDITASTENEKISVDHGIPLVAPDTVDVLPASEDLEEGPASTQMARIERMPEVEKNGEAQPASTDGAASSHFSPRTSSVGPLESLQQTDSRALSRTRTPPTTVNTPTSIKTEVPSLLRGTLREYQHHGLDWLAGLYAGNTNGILADEMGLGKTIQTIALLAHLADHGVWGPHLVVVPTSVMLNWEMEFKKFCPGFKVLTYYGDIEERRRKRSGWRDDNKWNVVITSYQLILKDAAAFKQRGWLYLILDEAHNIKNFQTQRWQTLLNFRTQKRLLLTGTPLQNNLSELWSLLFFLMPSGDDGQGGFTGLHNFTTAMSRPTNQILEQGKQQLDAEAQATVDQLHSILRPYLLRRLKADVEKQMPGKYEHVIYCRLSKRQRQLYDEFMGRTEVRQTLASGNYMSIINCLMSLRKVCNHPDLFETRQITTSFAMREPVTGMRKSAVADYEIKEFFVRKRLLQKADEQVSLDHLNLMLVRNESSSALDAKRSTQLSAVRPLEDLVEHQTRAIGHESDFDGSSISSVLAYIAQKAERSKLEHLKHCLDLTRRRAQRRPIYGTGLLRRLTLGLQDRLVLRGPRRAANSTDWYLNHSSLLQNMVLDVGERSQMMHPYVQKFACITPTVVADGMPALTLTPSGVSVVRQAQQLCPRDPFHEARMRLSIAFPDKRLLQYDCGKLQRLDALLRQLQAGGHRALIFTQMTKVLDILEQFLNIHGHRYLRLDGATKIEQRQILTDRFNNDPRILAFILSSRSGGLGINLTGADTVIFYDLDWNPAMDKQCQDRCHRIGQTRDVHIYRFVSEHTIEANILRKSNQKRLLDDVIIQKGDFTTDYFNRMTYRDAFDDSGSAATETEEDKEASAAMDRVLGNVTGLGQVLESVEDKEDTEAAKVAQKEMVHDVQVDQADFQESGHPSATPKASVPPTPQVANGPDVEAAGQSGAGQRAAETVKYEDEDRAHVDEFMLKHLLWERRDEKFVPPRDRRERRDRRGRDRNRKR
ncbi:swr1 complex component [Coniosporium apollinis]|uniref:Swr1 complex component n=1 Tax=Coniosporium apollinis TaxID=61459 RepID=A0ABQ9P6J2_9PEZI|nr:swr1 complex component [Coniosporium apollinis]